MHGKRDAVRSILCAMSVGAVGGTVVFYGATRCGFCQSTQEKSGLMINYVSPSLVAKDNLPPDRTKARAALLTEPLHDADGVVAAPPTTQTSADRWRKFDDEYGIQKKSPSPYLQAIQSAKYGLDTVTFGTEEAARQLEFTHDVGDSAPPTHQSGAAGPGRSIPLFGEFGQAQIKSVVTTHDPQTGAALAGLKLAIPFGPGGPRSDRYSERSWGADAVRKNVSPGSSDYYSRGTLSR